MHAFVVSQKRQNEIESRRDAGKPSRTQRTQRTPQATTRHTLTLETRHIACTGEEGYEQDKAAQMTREEHERMRTLWRRHGLGDELYRRFMMYLLNQRSQGMDSTHVPVSTHGPE